MMKALFGLFQRFDSKHTKLEIEEELRFHLDLLTDEHCRQDMPWADARDTALRRFGNVERIKDQCVEISRRNRPAIRALKLLMTLVFLTGVLVRVFSPEYHLTRVGDILMAVAVLSRLWIYVRWLNPSTFFSKPETSSPLRLSESQVLFTAYDQKKRTPLERIISGK